MSGKPDSRTDFAVVGAGLAGLRIAASLRAAGASVTVFEARDRVGGRVVSAPTAGGASAGPPLVLDLGGQWVGPGQTEMLELIKELGLHVIPTEGPGRTIWGLDGQLKQGRGSLPPLPPRALAEVLVSGARVALMVRRLAPDAPWQGAKARQWDRLTAEDWIRRHLRTRAGRDFARMYVRGDAAAEPSQTSVLGLLFDFRSVGPTRNLASTEAFRLREGAHELARRLAERIEDRIRFADPVRAIAQDADGVAVESDTGVLRCRRVAVCVPPPLASRIAYTPALPQLRARLLDNLPMGASVKFHAVYQRPFWRTRGLSGQAWTATGAVGLTYDNSPDDGTGRGVLVGLVVADEARRLSAFDPARQEQEILACLARLFGPEAGAPDALVVQDWSAEEWTGGCYAAYFPPNVWIPYGSAFRTPSGRIHWAGTETSNEWYGYMEGALRSGRRAAGEMLQADSGQPAATDREPRATRS
jgi:monoamine oxidase